jgi:diaminopimelate epimerase
MALYNADGSEAEVSGNGLRILAQHLRDLKLVTGRLFEIHTGCGVCATEVMLRSGNTQLTRIELARAVFDLELIPMRGETSHFINQLFATESGSLLGTAVNVGNPHIVFFVDTFDFDWRAFGAEVEKDRRFPNHTNVEFARILSRTRVVHCSWERGAGETRASGTGAAATVAAGVVNGLLDHLVTVQEPAGDLTIELRSLDDPIHLTGPSVRIGEGLFLFDQHG